MTGSNLRYERDRDRNMATATIDSLKVSKKTSDTPTAIECSGQYAMSITRTFSAVRVLERPTPIPDARGTLSNDRLRAIAKKHQPPQEWYEGDEEPLF